MVVFLLEPTKKGSLKQRRAHPSPKALEDGGDPNPAAAQALDVVQLLGPQSQKQHVSPGWMSRAKTKALFYGSLF